MIKGNKGEWSELYVFAKLLADGKLFQSDINLEKIESNFYEVTKAYREDSTLNLEFERQDQIKIYKVDSGKRLKIGELSIEYFRENSRIIYEGINFGKGNSFEIENLNDFFKDCHIKKLTALVTSKSDLKLQIYDHRLAKESDLGFSIKSLIGQDSTLFNTGPGNNFIYKVDNRLLMSINDFNINTYKPEGKLSKITYRIKKLIEDFGLNIIFNSIQSTQLYRNLKMIDGDLPELLGFALLYRWIYRISKMIDVVNILEEKDPMSFYKDGRTDQKLYEYKMKRFLAECAMGMTSETPWHGVYDATGGVIICKRDGEIVCFHIYDFNLFREYLLKNTMFEQPSTGEDEFNPGHPRTAKGTKKFYYGWLYEENERLFFKINLQIRFV